MTKAATQATPEGPGKPEVEARIRAGILSALGSPTEVYRVAVLPLWGNAYRVNVLTGEAPSGVRIASSYFVTADDRGGIVASVPPVVKLP